MSQHQPIRQSFKSHRSRGVINTTIAFDVEESRIGNNESDLENLNFIDERATCQIMEKALKLYFHAEKAKDANKCTLCNAPATKACGVCLTDYCSEECQNEDWPLHQKLCSRLASESAPVNQNQQALPQNMPPLERSIAPNVNHNFSGGKRRDPRLQRKGPPQLQNRQNALRNIDVQQPSNPHTQNYRNFSPQHQTHQTSQNTSRNVEVQEPLDPLRQTYRSFPPQPQTRQNAPKNIQAQQRLDPPIQTTRSFPPPRVDGIPESPRRQFNRPQHRPGFSHNVPSNSEIVDPRLANRYQFPPRESAPNILRGVDPQANVQHQTRLNENLVNNNNNNNNSSSNDLFHRRPDPHLGTRSTLVPSVTEPNPDIFVGQSEFNSPSSSSRNGMLPNNSIRREPPIDNRRMQSFQTESRGMQQGRPLENRKRQGPVHDNRRMSGYPVENRNLHGPLIGDRMNSPLVEHRNQGHFTDNRPDSPMDTGPVESPVAIDPPVRMPKIRVKSLDSLKEAPTPKPNSEKVVSRLIHCAADRESFSSIFKPSPDDEMEGLSDLDDIGDLDDIDMDTGRPERLNVIGIIREDNDKYWVCKEMNMTMWETMREEVQKCSHSRSIRPVVNSIAGCMYEGEWFRAKIIRVRPNIKVHYIDYGNTSIYKGEIKELPQELVQIEPLAFLIQFTENTPIKYLTKDLDGRKFEVEIIEKLENGISLIRIPQKENRSKINKPDIVPSLPNFSKSHPVIMCGFSINEVYIRPVDENSKNNFEKLQQDLELHSAQVRTYISPPSVGEMVCARCDVNKTYYRARVEFVADDLIRVYFVDYGEEQETLLRYLKPLSEELKSRPTYILKVRLVGVPSDHLPPEVTTYYNRLISKKVDLIMSYEDESDGVLLTETATAITVNDQVNKILLDKMKKSELLLEDSLKFIKLTTHEIKKLVISFIDKTEFFKTTIFYVTDPENQFYDYVNEKLAGEISDYCNKETTGFTPELKELCLAKFEGDWYRGINLECVNDTHYRIFFIDYGNESTVKRSCIRRMPKEFAEPPCLAIRSTIADSKKLANNKKLNEDIFEYLESNVSRSISQVEVVEVIEDKLTSLSVLRFPEIDRALTT